MKYSFKLANKIRTKLLLYIDEEIRTKANNILFLNQIKDNSTSIYEIRTKEESFSNSQVYDISSFNRNSIPEISLNNYCKFESHLTACSSSKIQSQNSIIENSKNNDFHSKKQKYFYHSNKKKPNKTLFKASVKNKKENSKEYLKNLCQNLINKSELNKYYQSNSKIRKKTRIYIESPKKKHLKRYSEKRKILKPPSINASSFKILLFACDY